ncbi:MAG: ORF6N domain-containing protein [Flavobacteriales bacterium]
MRSQFATSSWGGIRHLPMAFTEQGVAMLSSVLNSKKPLK